MTEQHQWGHIFRGAIPMSIGAVILFANMHSSWKWALLIAAMAGAYALVSMKTKKKADLFTAMAIVFVCGLGVHFLQGAGMI